MTTAFKKGEQNDPAKYRPVSVASVPCKLVEHIVTIAIMNHLKKHELLCDQQRGFRRNRFCETQLLELVVD